MNWSSWERRVGCRYFRLHPPHWTTCAPKAIATDVLSIPAIGFVLQKHELLHADSQPALLSLSSATW